ncbi:MAG: hypothetical protein JO361_00880 [Gammaproteobacteria bacterium]|nr:hypothetical protein [Gammaproteobacteria bacterium]
MAAVNAGGKSMKSSEASATPQAPSSGGGGSVGGAELLLLGLLVTWVRLGARAAAPSARGGRRIGTLRHACRAWMCALAVAFTTVLIDEINSAWSAATAADPGGTKGSVQPD